MRTKANSTCIKTFCENLILLLKERGVSQTKLCNDCDISIATMSRLVNGERNPSLDTVYKIAKYFGVSIDELVGINAEKTVFDKTELEKEIRLAKKTKKLLKKLYEELYEDD